MNKTVKIILGFFVTIFILMLSSTFEVKITSIFNFIPSGLTSQIVILTFSSILIYFFNKKGIINFNIGKVTIKQIIPPILLTVLLLIIAEFIFSRVLGNANEEHFTSAMSGIQIVFIVVILASISEELLFRGFLQNILEPIKSYGIKILNLKLSLPVIISGILFGLIHFGIITTGGSFNFAIKIVLSAIIMGMIAGYFQEKYNNFLFAIIVHMTANISGVLLSISVN